MAKRHRWNGEKLQMRAWALEGAKREIERIYSIFPELRPVESAVVGLVPRNRKSTWTPARRKAHAQRMKVYWRKRRNA